MGILVDVPVHAGKFIILSDFIVLDMDENFQAPLIFERPFLATVGVGINVLACIMSFQLCGKRVDFCFPQPTPSSLPATFHLLQPMCSLSFPMLLLGQWLLMAIEDLVCGLPFCSMSLRQFLSLIHI